MDEPKQASQLPDIPNTPLKRWVKFLADLLPTIGFFGVFLLFGRDLMHATAGLAGGLVLQLALYKVIGQRIPKWMKYLTGIAFAFAALTFALGDTDYIKLLSTVSGLLIGCVLVGSVLIKKNVFELILGKLIIFPTRTWNIITLLWSVPIFLNAGLNLVLANLIPWIDLQVSDDFWVGYRFVRGFISIAFSFGIVILYLVLTKQRPQFGDAVNAPEES